MKKNVLVAGGAGFIGSHLCESLLESGFSVWALDNFFTGKKSHLKKCFEFPTFKLIKADASRVLPKEVTSTTWSQIYHLASPAGPHPKASKSYLKYPVETYLVNSLGTHQLLKLAHKHNASFLFASTSEVYGDPKVHPQTEDYHGNVNPIGPRACYDESKRFGEMAVSVWYKKHQVKAKSARIFNTYGPRMNVADGRVTIEFITRALKNEPLVVFGDGEQTRSFCFIDDMVKGLMGVMEKLSPGEVVNLGNPDEITINQLAEKIVEITKSDSKVVYKPKLKDDPKRRRPDISKAKKVLGWQPEVNLDKGLKKMEEWVKLGI